MCTTIAYSGKEFAFGRNMDLEYTFGDRVIMTPRNFPISFKCAETVSSHKAILGAGAALFGYPFYAEAMNENGLCMAGLNFPKYSHFEKEPAEGRLNLAPFEMIPYFLSVCSSVDEVKKLAENLCIVDIPYNAGMPTATLHWHVADKHGSVVIESVEGGVKFYDDKVGVLTNSPTFPEHLLNLDKYASVSAAPPSALKERIHLGFGGIGLPGDASAMSRFVRSAFFLKNLPKDLEGDALAADILDVLTAVGMPDGSVVDSEGTVHKTVYSACLIPEEKRCVYKFQGKLGVVSASFDEFRPDSNALSEKLLKI